MEIMEEVKPRPQQRKDLRQMGVAIASYVRDFSDFPPGLWSSMDAGPFGFWVDMLVP